MAPKLPNIKDLVLPFMTEAIDETMLENQSQENIEEPEQVRNEAGYANMNRWPEKMNPMDAETFFRYQDPNPI